MRKIINTPKPTTMALFSFMFLGMLVFVVACGNSSTTTGATSSTPQTQATSTTATSGNGYGSGGRYGSGGSTTPTAVTGTTPTTQTTGATQTITITTDSSGTFTFSPKSLTIKVGTTVIWKNMTQTPHTVTSDDGKSFNSGDSTPVNAGATFSFKFATAGTFAYHCNFHPFMTATIIVQ